MRKVKFSFVVLIGLLVSVCTAFAQISGPTPVNLGQIETYRFYNGTIYSSYTWGTGGKGYLVSTSNEGANFYARIQWLVAGSATITFFDNNRNQMGSHSVTINNNVSTPTATFTITQNCNSTTVTRSANTSGVDWYWQTSPTGMATNLGSTNTIVRTTPGSLYLRAKFSDTGTWSSGYQTVGNINIVTSVGSPSSSTDGHRISNNALVSVMLQVSPVSGTDSYKWYTDVTGGNAVSSGISATSYNAQLSGTRTFYVETVNGPCTSTPRKSVTGYIHPEPIVIVSNGGKLYNGKATLSVSNYSYDTYAWLNSSKQVIPGATGSSYIVDATGTYYLQVTKANSPAFISGPITISSINYIIATDVLADNVYNVNDAHQLISGSRNQTTQFFDGLGRPLQNVTWQSSPTNQDLIQPVVYDAAGREAKKYLPISSGTDGWYKGTSTIVDPVTGSYVGVAEPFYKPGSDNAVADDVVPYTETVFESSPLNRPIKSYGAGGDWAANSSTNPNGANKYIESQYTVNIHGEGTSSEEKIIAWKVSSSGSLEREPALTGTIESGGYFSSGQLKIQNTIDESGNSVREYFNKEGKVILKKVQVVAGAVNLNSATDWALTYYIYDDFGNLAFVLPPQAAEVIKSSSN
ncbi:DUF6443 domain-containing protein [Ohtaekwangia koreensis]|nr:DUF6443 domain-containing protein [Ohtaekwangia koreensis]